jgi:hypothetical protein
VILLNAPARGRADYKDRGFGRVLVVAAVCMVMLLGILVSGNTNMCQAIVVSPLNFQSFTGIQWGQLPFLTLAKPGHRLVLLQSRRHSSTGNSGFCLHSLPCKRSLINSLAAGLLYKVLWCIHEGVILSWSRHRLFHRLVCPFCTILYTTLAAFPRAPLPKPVLIELDTVSCQFQRGSEKHLLTWPITLCLEQQLTIRHCLYAGRW